MTSQLISHPHIDNVLTVTPDGQLKIVSSTPIATADDCMKFLLQSWMCYTQNSHGTKSN